VPVTPFVLPGVTIIHERWEEARPIARLWAVSRRAGDVMLAKWDWRQLLDIGSRHNNAMIIQNELQID